MARPTAARVVVLDDSGRVLLDVLVPLGELATDEPAPVEVGWQVTDRGAHYDGKSVIVAPSRRKLLRVLVEADEALTAKELTGRAFDLHTDEANTRYHIRELKKELAKAFPEFEGCMVGGDGTVTG